MPSAIENHAERIVRRAAARPENVGFLPIVLIPILVDVIAFCIPYLLKLCPHKGAAQLHDAACSRVERTGLSMWTVRGKVGEAMHAKGQGPRALGWERFHQVRDALAEAVFDEAQEAGPEAIRACLAEVKPS